MHPEDTSIDQPIFETSIEMARKKSPAKQQQGLAPSSEDVVSSKPEFKSDLLACLLTDPPDLAVVCRLLNWACHDETTREQLVDLERTDVSNQREIAREIYNHLFAAPPDLAGAYKTLKLAIYKVNIKDAAKYLDRIERTSRLKVAREINKFIYAEPPDLTGICNLLRTACRATISALDDYFRVYVPKIYEGVLDASRIHLKQVKNAVPESALDDTVMSKEEWSRCIFCDMVEGRPITIPESADEVYWFWRHHTELLYSHSLDSWRSLEVLPRPAIDTGLDVHMRGRLLKHKAAIDHIRNLMRSDSDCIPDVLWPAVSEIMRIRIAFDERVYHMTDIEYARKACVELEYVGKNPISESRQPSDQVQRRLVGFVTTCELVRQKDRGLNESTLYKRLERFRSSHPVGEKWKIDDAIGSRRRYLYLLEAVQHLCRRRLRE